MERETHLPEQNLKIEGKHELSTSNRGGNALD